MEIDLVDISADDIGLYELMFCDPVHMAELGGPQPREKVPSILNQQLTCVSTGKGWVFKIVPKSLGTAVGTICVWGGFHDGKDINEIGWGVAPKYQNNGYGSAAVKAIIEKAKITGRWDVIHAFTSTTNVPSNKICEKTGFQLLGVCDIDYDSRVIVANHWVIDVQQQATVDVAGEIKA